MSSISKNNKKNLNKKSTKNKKVNNFKINETENNINNNLIIKVNTDKISSPKKLKNNNNNNNPNKILETNKGKEFYKNLYIKYRDRLAKEVINHLEKFFSHYRKEYLREIYNILIQRMKEYKVNYINVRKNKDLTQNSGSKAIFSDKEQILDDNYNNKNRYVYKKKPLSLLKEGEKDESINIVSTKNIRVNNKIQVKVVRCSHASFQTMMSPQYKIAKNRNIDSSNERIKSIKNIPNIRNCLLNVKPYPFEKEVNKKNNNNEDNTNKGETRGSTKLSDLINNSKIMTNNINNNNNNDGEIFENININEAFQENNNQLKKIFSDEDFIKTKKQIINNNGTSEKYQSRNNNNNQQNQLKDLVITSNKVISNNDNNLKNKYCNTTVSINNFNSDNGNHTKLAKKKIMKVSTRLKGAGMVIEKKEPVSDIKKYNEFQNLHMKINSQEKITKSKFINDEDSSDSRLYEHSIENILSGKVFKEDDLDKILLNQSNQSNQSTSKDLNLSRYKSQETMVVAKINKIKGDKKKKNKKVLIEGVIVLIQVCSSITFNIHREIFPVIYKYLKNYKKIDIFVNQIKKYLLIKLRKEGLYAVIINATNISKEVDDNQKEIDENEKISKTNSINSQPEKISNSTGVNSNNSLIDVNNVNIAINVNENKCKNEEVKKKENENKNAEKDLKYNENNRNYENEHSNKEKVIEEKFEIKNIDELSEKLNEFKLNLIKFVFNYNDNNNNSNSKE